MNRLRALLLTVGFGIAVALPSVPGLTGDDFPISTYPMFSGRQSETATIARAEGVRADGSTGRLEPSLVANDEVIQAFETIRQAIGQGPEATMALCQRIASRLDRDDYESVRIVTARFDVIDYFEDNDEPLSSTLHASCEVAE